MERNIPDVRDIFGRCTSSDSSHRKQELRSYEYSPRSRRKHETVEDYDIRAPASHHDSRSNAVSGGTRKSNRHRQSVPDDFPEPVRQKKSEDGNQKTANSRSKDSAHYSNRTLTERDIRHLERHLSMKKTIRKQISRNLAQAFVDDPELVMKDPIQPVTKSGNNHKVSVDRTFTLTRAKVSKSEQNVLDLLKDNEPDSGHCSADNPNSSDDDSQEQTKERPNGKYSEKTSGNSRPVVDNRSKQDQPFKDDAVLSTNVPPKAPRHTGRRKPSRFSPVDITGILVWRK